MSDSQTQINIKNSNPFTALQNQDTTKAQHTPSIQTGIIHTTNTASSLQSPIAPSSSSFESVPSPKSLKFQVIASTTELIDENSKHNSDNSKNNFSTYFKTVGPDVSSDATEYRTYKRRWIGLFGLALLNIVVSWGWLSFSALSLETAKWFQLSSQAPVNWLSSVILFAYVVSSPVVAYVLDQYGVKCAMFICAALLVVGNWVRYAGVYTQTFGVTMLGQILIGLAQPFSLSAPAHFTNIWFTSQSRVSANAIASISNPLGGAIAQIIGPSMVSQPSDLKNFILLTSCVATAASLVAFVAPTRPPVPPSKSASLKMLSLRESFKLLIKSPVFLVALFMFSIYVGLFNAYSTFINQIMQPYGYSSDVAGYTDAILIVSGIVFVAIASPILDRFHHYILFFGLALPIIAGCYVALIFTQTRDKQVVGPFIVSGVLGAVSFSLLPAILEWIQEQTFPATPALSSSLLWNGGQLLGVIFIIAMDALKYNDDQGSPPGNMNRALIFQAVWASVGVIPVFLLKRISRSNARIEMDLKV